MTRTIIDVLPGGVTIGVRTQMAEIKRVQKGLLYIPHRIRYAQKLLKPAGVDPRLLPDVGEMVFPNGESDPVLLGQSPFFVPGPMSRVLVYANNQQLMDLADWRADIYSLDLGDEIPRGFGGRPITVTSNDVVNGTVIDLVQIEGDISLSAIASDPAGNAISVEIDGFGTFGFPTTLFPFNAAFVSPALPNTRAAWLGKFCGRRVLFTTLAGNQQVQIFAIATIQPPTGGM